MSEPTALAKPRKTGPAYLLWLGGLFGIAGLHRFYMGRWVSGTLWLLTGGFCFVGQLIDLLMMPRMIEDSNRGAGW
ncbi:MAG: TM2 domain-containing protein [Myxococcota bacterium]|nr:TM2 domain-containing protein [Myxococcota bacterium]